MLEIVNRSIDAQAVERLRTAGVDARLSRLYAAANSRGCRVTRPTLPPPGREFPGPASTLTPTRGGWGSPSTPLAGVGVIFYVMLALRAELRRRGAFAAKVEPPLAELLDLVALGTVADVARLDANNRTLVAQGVARIRAGRASPGIAALLQVAGRDPRRVCAYDLGFVVGPRLNAAGRIDDMSIGIECLLAGDRGRALELAQRLDSLNRERRAIESEMQESTLAMDLDIQAGEGFSLVVHRADWHPGVGGHLRSRP